MHRVIEFRVIQVRYIDCSRRINALPMDDDTNDSITTRWFCVSDEIFNDGMRLFHDTNSLTELKLRLQHA
jgi:hypothetical protein